MAAARSLSVLVPITVPPWCDMRQTQQALTRDFPPVERARYLLEMIRPGGQGVHRVRERFPRWVPDRNVWASASCGAA